MAKVFLLTGSNRGDRIRMLREAEARIAEVIGTVRNSSAVYETEPWGFTDKTPFLNQALMIESDLSPGRVLEEILGIETSMGRQRSSTGYQSRDIDIDILLYDNWIFFSEELTIPHPRIAERKFVLIPLAEIAGEYFHPVNQCTIAELLVTCRDNSKVERYNQYASGNNL